MTTVNLFFCLAFQSLSFLSFRTRKDATTTLHEALDRGDDYVDDGVATSNHGTTRKQ